MSKSNERKSTETIPEQAIRTTKRDNRETIGFRIKSGTGMKVPPTKQYQDFQFALR